MNRLPVLLSFIIFAVLCRSFADDVLPSYKMCVPHHIFDACKTLMDKPSTFATIECVPARDRMECLSKVNKREADFLAVDPEDMYVAFNMKNEDFSVFSEIRTVEESEAEFRYEGIILVHKNSDIHSLADLRNKKSCHTGYGRNVGYKIPITKLKKHGVLKLSTDPQLSFVEKELKGLTDLFSSSCLVGTYSPNEEVNRVLKKRYSNLCALCEDPVRCNYPDKYSGYDGSIRCLVENGGDVAFTKVIFVRRYFGLPIGNNPATTEAQANPDDYEYLCEDGKRKPVTGPSCTWAQRPWQGYMGNSDVNSKLTRLQDRINAFYNEGKKLSDKELKAKMWINEKNVVVKKEQQTLPGDHLTKAQYKDVIERNGNMQIKIRLCVTKEVEQRKCDIMRRAAFSRDIRPEFECILKSDCIQAVHEKTADAAVLPGILFKDARANHLTPVLYEMLDETLFYVALVDKNLKTDVAKKAAIFFDRSNPRSIDAALYFNHKRNIEQCPSALQSIESAQIRIIQARNNTDGPEFENKELICPDMSRKPLTELTTCNFNENVMGGAVFVRNDLSGNELETLAHGFTALSDKFGHGYKNDHIFEVFEEFETGAKNVIFGDDTGKLVPQSNYVGTVDEDLYNRLYCIA